MKKKMNLVQLSGKQQSNVRAGAEPGDNTCTKFNRPCPCACPQGVCLPDIASSSYEGCMPNPA